MTTAQRRSAPSVPRSLAYGLLMGGADVVPGVSGGTMALIVGIYEALIQSLRALAGAVVALGRGRVAEARAALLDVQWRLVVPLGVGILVAVAVGSVVIEPLLEEYPEEMRAVFFGLVAGSLAVPWARARADRASVWRVWPPAALAAVIAFVLVGLPTGVVEDPSLLRVFASATVAICAMILPGVSGAFLLLVLGLYEPTLAAARNLDVVYVGTFALGAALGLGAFARVLGWLLHRHHTVTMATLVGLMAGSLRALWPWQDADRALQAPPTGVGSLGVLLLALLGWGAVTLLVRKGDRALRVD